VKIISESLSHDEKHVVPTHLVWEKGRKKKKTYVNVTYTRKTAKKLRNALLLVYCRLFYHLQVAAIFHVTIKIQRNFSEIICRLTYTELTSTW
jgi:hypothetical protein